jgi:S1-C subfamily serine protease
MINPKYRGPLAVLVIGLVLPVLMLSCGFFTPASVKTVTEQPVRTVVVVVTPQAPQQPPQQVVASSNFEEDAILVDLYARVNPAVVNITVYQRQNGVVTPVGQGSGFVYDGDGHIVTNAHVVHGSEQFEVTFSDGSSRSATVVGEDLNSDLAVVKVDNLPEGVNPLPLGDMESLAAGQSVVAIGNPFGLEGTLTRGIISALGRSIPALTIFNIPQAIQTDAAINPGNSGGPLLNLNGEVIGVNAQIETGGVSQSNLGIGFAIPVSIVKLVVPDLIQNGVHHWAWMGVQGGNLTSALVKAMKLPVDKGAYIAQVINNGPSEKAGLRGAGRTETVDGREVEVGGDVITAIDGQPVNTFDDLLIYVALSTQPGQEVQLTILRGGETQEIKVKLEERPENLQVQP